MFLKASQTVAFVGCAISPLLLFLRVETMPDIFLFFSEILSFTHTIQLLPVIPQATQITVTIFDFRKKKITISNHQL